MKAKDPILITMTFLVLLAPDGSAKEPDRFELFIEDEVEWIITKEEAKSWKRLGSDADREAFIALFWARRDPTPGTARNEFREKWAQRLSYADANYGTSREEGRKTDRGRVYCLLGPPSREGTFRLPGAGGGSRGDDPVSAAGAPASVGGGMRGSLPPILWTYENLPPALGIKTLEVRFVDYEGFGSYSLDAGGAAAAALKKAVEAAITEPDLTKAPELPPDTATTEAPPLGITSPELKALLGKPKPGEGGAYTVGLEMGSFVLPSGSPFVPIAVGVIGMERPGRTRHFYRVSSDAGVVRDEETAEPGLFMRTLPLSPGDYRLEVGVMDRDSGKHGYISRDLSVPAPPAGLSLSSVLVAKSTEMLPAPAPETEPFTFGQLRLIPSLDRTFQKADELMIFVEAYGVTEDQAQAATLHAAYAFERAGKFWNEIPEAPQQAVRLSPGRYLLTQIIGLSRFAPASYQLRVTVRDALAPATASAATGFSVK